MALLNWSDEYLIGIESVDAEHRWLIDSVNNFHDLQLHGDSDAVRAMVSDLTDYICEHFRNEEGIMARYNYPDRDSHAKEHKKLAVRVRDIEDRLRNESVVSAAELSGFILDWITEHILKSDRTFGEFVKTVGEE
jgi:hemerythrin